MIGDSTMTWPWWLQDFALPALRIRTTARGPQWDRPGGIGFGGPVDRHWKIHGKNIPAGGKLNPRFVCSWRSYARHWMRNAWFWQTIQFMIFAVPLCFVFFLHFAMFSAFMSFQNQRHFFAVFLKYAGFSTFLRAFFSIAKDSHLDWTVSFKTLAVFWNKLVCEEVQEDLQ